MKIIERLGSAFILLLLVIIVSLSEGFKIYPKFCIFLSALMVAILISGIDCQDFGWCYSDHVGQD